MSVNYITGVNNIFTSNTNATNINISAGTNELLNINANSITGLNNITVTQLTGLVPTLSNSETYSQTLNHSATGLGPTVKAMAHGKFTAYNLLDFLFVTLPKSSINNSGGLVIYSNTGPSTSFSYLYTINAPVPTTNTALIFGNTVSVDRYGSGFMIVTEPSTQSMFLYICEYPNTNPWILDGFYAPNNTIYDDIAASPTVIVSSSIAKIAGNYIISADSTGIVNLTQYGSTNTTTKLYNNASGAVVAIGITGSTTPISAFVQNNYLYVYLGTTIQQSLFLNEAGVDIEFDNTGHYMYVLTTTKFYIYYSPSITSFAYMRIHSENSSGGAQLSAYSNSTYNFVSYWYGSNNIVTFANTISSSQPDLFIKVGTFNTTGLASALSCFCMTDTDVFAGDYSNTNSYVYLTTSTNVNVNNVINDGLTDFSNTTIPISFNDIYANNATITNVSANSINAVTFNGQYNFNFLYAGLPSSVSPALNTTYTVPFTSVYASGFASFNSSAGILTFLQGGYYLFSANVGLTSTGTSTVYASFVVNNTTTIDTAAVVVSVSIASLQVIGTAVYQFNAGDTLRITTYGSGSAYSVFGGNTYTNMTVIKLL